MEQPSNINITPIDRAFLQGQGILKGMGSQIKKRKMQKKPMQKNPKLVNASLDAAKNVIRGEMGKSNKAAIEQAKKGMAKELEKMRMDRMKKGGPSSLSEWPATPKGLYKSKKK